MKSYQHLYSRFLEAHPGVQHFASHSHHYWPDVTLQAHIEYWNDSCLYVDHKWDHIFKNKIPQAQKLIAQNLNLSKPEQIVFAPNTHELVYRVLSAFPKDKKIKVLTTDSEFYSFDRQISRLSEEALVSVEKVPVDPIETFEKRFIEKIQKQTYDLVFFSQVFFNSGYLIKNLDHIVAQIKTPETIIMIDGYHGFMAVPTDLSLIEKRIFYVAGSYKYAQGGEGCCFLWVPPGNTLRPLQTGWFAGFGALAKYDGKVEYSADGFRFAGSTMDFSALYRLIASLELFAKEGLTVNVIHNFILERQKAFLDEVAKYQNPKLSLRNCLLHDWRHHGHFLTFQMASNEECAQVAKALQNHGIWTDFRGDRLRFGFGLYHGEKYDLSCLETI